MVRWFPEHLGASKKKVARTVLLGEGSGQDMHWKSNQRKSTLELGARDKAGKRKETGYRSC